MIFNPEGTGNGRVQQSGAKINTVDAIQYLAGSVPHGNFTGWFDYFTAQVNAEWGLMSIRAANQQVTRKGAGIERIQANGKIRTASGNDDIRIRIRSD